MRNPVLALGVASILATVACGSPTAGPVTQTAPESGKPRPGGALNLHVPVDPFDWDLSFVGKSNPNGYGQGLAYESLLGFKAGPGIRNEELILRPELAETWEVSADAKTYTFHLRKGVKWANLPPVNGRDLTSADVKWAFEYWSRTGALKDRKLPQGQFDYMFEGLDSIDTPDTQTAVVRFKQPFVPFLNYAASDFNPIAPHEIYDADGHLKDKIVGTGPFQLDTAASQKGSRWVWKKNPTYWDAGKPLIDEVRWLVLADDASAIAAFRTKQIDLLNNNVLNYRQVEDLKKSMPQVQILPGTGYGGHIYLQTQRPPFDNEKVRVAFSKAIDRDDLSALDTGTKAVWTPAGALIGAFTDEEARQLIKADPTEAKQLLADAGYPNGVSVTWEFPGKAYGDGYVTLLEHLQAQLKRAGFTVNLKSMDKDDFSSQRKVQNFGVNMTPAPCGGSTDDPDQVIFGCYYSKSKANYGAVNDPELDKLLFAQRSEPSLEKRRQLLRDVVKRVNDKAWAVELFYPPLWEAAQPWLKGYAPNLGAKGWYLNDAWLEK